MAEAPNPAAFPLGLQPDFHLAQAGMTQLEYYAAHAPIGFNEAVQALGTYPNLQSDRDRVAFIAVWARLRFEYADAMLRERQNWNL
jgi:hypothetical protein